MVYFILLAFYVLCSIVSQFLTSTPLHLFDIGSIPIWLPISAVTLVPLVDVMRSFTQHAGEQRGMTFKAVGTQMLLLSFAVSATCVMFAGLPLPIFTGVLLAVTLGGLIDVLVFKRMGKFFTSPVKRMAFSNAGATLVGSGIVFAVAFTDLVFANNSLAVPYTHAIAGWLCQSLFIWCSSLVIAAGLDKVVFKKVNNNA